MAHTTVEGPNWIQVNVDSVAGDFTTDDAKMWTKVYLGSADKAALLASGQSIVVAEVNPQDANAANYPRKRLTIPGYETEMRLSPRVPAKLLIDISQSTMTDWTKALIILEHQ